jgi:hypothetical protein
MAALLYSAKANFLVETDEAVIYASKIMLLVDDVPIPVFGAGALQDDFLVLSPLQGTGAVEQQGAVNKLQGGIMPGGVQG